MKPLGSSEKLNPIGKPCEVTGLTTGATRTANHNHVSDWPNGDARINRVEVVCILLVQMPAISQTKTKPATRINLDTTEHVNRIIVEGVRSVATNVGRRSHFGNRLDVLV